MLNMATPLPALAIIKIDPSSMLGISKSHLKYTKTNKNINHILLHKLNNCVYI